MATIEERLAYVEGRVQEHTLGMQEFRTSVAGLERRFDLLGARVDTLDRKVDRVREELSGRMQALDLKVDRVRDELSDRLGALDQKLTRGFLWIVGVQLTVLLAVVGALLRVVG